MGKIIWICVGAVIVWAGTILLMHRIQTKKIKKLEDDYREKQRVQQKLREEYSVKVQNKQAKIAALQSQINPHFLYNTLECIRSEALLYECDSIARMAKALAAFFRYSISNKENIVTIRDELRELSDSQAFAAADCGKCNLPWLRDEGGKRKGDNTDLYDRSGTGCCHIG